MTPLWLPDGRQHLEPIGSAAALGRKQRLVRGSARPREWPLSLPSSHSPVGSVRSMFNHCAMIPLLDMKAAVLGLLIKPFCSEAIHRLLTAALDPKARWAPLAHLTGRGTLAWTP